MTNEKRRLIDANKADEIIWARYDEAFMQSHTRPNIAWREGYSAGVNWARNTLLDMPTADAVEVVRCKDCRYRGTLYSNHLCQHPKVILSKVTDDDFCSYGERIGNERKAD